MGDDFKFEVGSTYKNMKGAYEVVSINRDTMVIRWDDDQRVTTSVDLQKRILERMRYDKELQQQKNEGKKHKK